MSRFVPPRVPQCPSVSLSVPVRVPMRVPQRFPVRVPQLVPQCPGVAECPGTSPAASPALSRHESRHSGCPESGQVPVLVLVPNQSKSRYPTVPILATPRYSPSPGTRLSKSRYEFRQALGVLEFFSKNFSKCWKEEGVPWFTRDLWGKKKGNKSLGR